MKGIADFYKDKDIFITGASGFLGKVLLEKLLRSCPDVRRIFILMRPKKSKTLIERLEAILNLPLFDHLITSNPSVINKIYLISGDVKETNLGISNEDMKLIKDVSIVFHSAASVRFDDPLKDAILMNTKGTHELLKVAEQMANIEVVVHISTTYCNPDKHLIEEKLYPPYADWRSSIKIAENCNSDILNILSPKYSNYQPNTYTFTKNLAEQIVNDYKDKLPLVIYRPSIVISTYMEPIPGWVDNFNGPVGMYIASGTGLLRTAYGDPNNTLDYTPVDVVTKGVILAAYNRGIMEERRNALPIYNCASSAVRPVTSATAIETAKELIWEIPFEKTLWVPDGGMTKCRYYNYIRVVFVHILIAILVDLILKLTRNKPFLLKLQRKIYEANCALSYFMITKWTFYNDKFMALDELVPQDEYNEFGFTDVKNVELREFLMNALIGAKMFLLKEKMDKESINKAKRKLRIINAIDKTIKTLFLAIFIYLFIEGILLPRVKYL